MKNVKLPASEILDSLPAGVAVIGLNGKTLFVNRRILEKNRVTFDEVTKNPFELVHEEDRELALEFFKKALRGRLDEIPYPFTIRFKTKDGVIHWNEVRHKLIDSDGDRYVIMVFTDITEKIELKNKVDRLNSYLRFLNKMLRHDILNVLTSILGYSEILDCENDEFVEKIKKAVGRGIETINRIRVLESVSDERREPVRLREVFEEVFSTYPLKYSIEGDATVMANEGLYSVFGNIVENAIRHGEASEVRVTIKNMGRFAEIRISDNGKGIDEKDLGRIFNEGFGKGSGLGLYIARTLVENYGGEIRAESDNGATFIIKLPLADLTSSADD